MEHTPSETGKTGSYRKKQQVHDRLDVLTNYFVTGILTACKANSKEIFQEKIYRQRMYNLHHLQFPRHESPEYHDHWTCFRTDFPQSRYWETCRWVLDSCDYETTACCNIVKCFIHSRFIKIGLLGWLHISVNNPAFVEKLYSVGSL